MLESRFVKCIRYPWGVIVAALHDHGYAPRRLGALPPAAGAGPIVIFPSADPQRRCNALTATKLLFEASPYDHDLNERLARSIRSDEAVIGFYRHTSPGDFDYLGPVVLDICKHGNPTFFVFRREPRLG